MNLHICTHSQILLTRVVVQFNIPVSYLYLYPYLKYLAYILYVPTYIHDVLHIPAHTCTCLTYFKALLFIIFN